MYLTKIFNFEYVLPCNKSIRTVYQNGIEIKGSACIYNLIDFHHDMILSGAFSEYLDSLKTIGGANKMPHMYYEHRPSENKTGKWTSVYDTEDELKVHGILKSKDIIQQALIGAINSLSVGFYIKEAEIQDTVRIIKKASLVEVSLVNVPANSKAYFTAKERLDCLRSKLC